VLAWQRLFLSHRSRLQSGWLPQTIRPPCRTLRGHTLQLIPICALQQDAHSVIKRIDSRASCLNPDSVATDDFHLPAEFAWVIRSDQSLRSDLIIRIDIARVDIALKLFSCGTYRISEPEHVGPTPRLLLLFFAYPMVSTLQSTLSYPCNVDVFSIFVELEVHLRRTTESAKSATLGTPDLSGRSEK
jgi:hypothetical protein